MNKHSAAGQRYLLFQEWTGWWIMQQLPSAPPSYKSPLERSTCEQFSISAQYKINWEPCRLFNANVKQVINVTQLVVGKMVAEKQPGSVVNVSSQASQAALGDHTVYCATKGALDMVTKWVEDVKRFACKEQIFSQGSSPWVWPTPSSSQRSQPYCYHDWDGKGEICLWFVCQDLSDKICLAIFVWQYFSDKSSVCKLKVGWSDPAKAGPMLAKIPLGRWEPHKRERGRVSFSKINFVQGLQRLMMWSSVFSSSWALDQAWSMGSQCLLMAAFLPPKNTHFILI